MKNHRTLQFGLSGLLLAGGGLFLLTGCGGDDEPPVVQHREPAPPPPEPDPEPRYRPVADLMQELRIDERVRLPEDIAPRSTEKRIAILELFDGFARGDDQNVRNRLSDPDRRELDRMVETGVWDEATKDIEWIEIQYGDSRMGEAVLALFSSDGGQFQVQKWLMVTDDQNEFVFEAVSTPPEMVNRLSGDWIAAWDEVIEEEMELAGRSDEDVQVPQTVLDDSDDADEQERPRYPGSGRRPGEDGLPAPRRPPGPPPLR